MKNSLYILFTVFLYFVDFNAVFASECHLVTTSNQVLQALKHNKKVICLADGVYQFDKTIIIRNPYTSLRSVSNDPSKVILQGKGMRQTKSVNNLIWVTASHVNITGLTLREAGNHLVQVAGEKDVDHFYMSDCILQDAYEQLFKVSKDRSGKFSSDFGIIERTVFEYTKGIGPNWYIGGIDVHTGKQWLIKDNAFFNIASPVKHIAEHAVHFWSNSVNPKVVGNLILNSDRGIGFGMASSKHQGGLISSNFIYHNNLNHPFSDVGIALESSSNTSVLNNIVWLKGHYANAIEYRFSSDIDNVISQNLINKRIKKRNGGQAQLKQNKITVDENFLLDKLNVFVREHPLNQYIVANYPSLLAQ